MSATRIIYWFLLVFTLLEFRADIHGDATLIGCYLRGFDRHDDGRCK